MFLFSFFFFFFFFNDTATTEIYTLSLHDALPIPPELSQPRFDDRFTVSTASGLAAANAARPRQSDLLPTNPDARIARAGNERWIVATATPDQAWSTVRQFWTENGF